MRNANHKNFRFFASILGLCTFLIITTFSSASTNQAQPEVIRIASHNLSPYHWVNDENKFTGPALHTLECIFSNLSQPFEISIYPWPRAQELVRIESYDAFFIGSKNEKRDQYATFAQPFYFDSWYLYFNPNKTIDINSDQIKESYLGVLLGSNMEQWLIKKGYKNLLSGRDYSHLFKLLNIGRLELVMATKGIYNAQMDIGWWTDDKFVSKKIRDLEMGIYFGHHFIKAFPYFLKKFNEAAKNCQQQ